LKKLSRKWYLDYKDLERFIEELKRTGVTPAEAAASECYDYGLVNAYAEYEDERQAAGWMDFGSMVAEAITLLEDPAFRKKWQYEYVLVDEAQDTDDQQFRMLQLLSEKHGNVLVVGDANQCIYGFRGAVPENLARFQKWFPGGKYFYLGRNHRSTRAIVRFIRENAPKDTPKELLDKMLAARDVEGKPIELKMYWNENDEAESAIALANQNPTASIILARTNAWLGLLQAFCDANNVRYHLLGQEDFWKRNEILKAGALLRSFLHLDLPRAMDAVIGQLRRNYEVDDRTNQDNWAVENILRLADISKKHSSAREFANYLNRMAHRRNIVQGITLGTVHAAKGGEWKNVFIVGVRADLMPHKKAENLLEEERIWFVAISRAIDELRISWTGTPSPYLRRYLSADILAQLQKQAESVEKIQKQHSLF